MYASLAKELLRSFRRYNNKLAGAVKIALYPDVLAIDGSVMYDVEFDKTLNQLVFNININDVFVEEAHFASRIIAVLEMTNENTGISLVYSGYTGEQKSIPVSAVLKNGGIYLVKQGRNYVSKRRNKGRKTTEFG